MSVSANSPSPCVATPADLVRLPSRVRLLPASAGDDARILGLHETVFGPGRFARTAFRLRETADPLPAYALVALEDDILVGAVSLSRITVGTQRGVLLGPLAVLADRRDLGIGKALLLGSVSAAFAAGEPFVLLVGDAPYYAAAGFGPVPRATMAMPGPVDPARLLVALHPQTSSLPSGAVRGCAD